MEINKIMAGTGIFLTLASYAAADSISSRIDVVDSISEIEQKLENKSFKDYIDNYMCDEIDNYVKKELNFLNKYYGLMHKGIVMDVSKQQKYFVDMIRNELVSYKEGPRTYIDIEGEKPYVSSEYVAVIKEKVKLKMDYFVRFMYSATKYRPIKRHNMLNLAKQLLLNNNNLNYVNKNIEQFFNVKIAYCREKDK